MTQDIDDLIAALERSPHDSLCAARWPDSSVPCYCDRSMKLKAADALREQRDEIARLEEQDSEECAVWKKCAERAEAERDAAIQLISDMEPYWKTITKGRIWDAATAGIMASIRSRIDAALTKLEQEDGR